MTITPAWMGQTCDHLFEGCPNRAKARAQLEQHGWWKQCIVGVSPDDTDLCGWCVRVWKARNRPVTVTDWTEEDA